MASHDASPDASTAPPAAAPRPAAPRRRGASLRLRVNALVLALMVVFIAALGWLRIDTIRASVREEITGSNRVATQLLQRVSWIFTRGGPPAMLEFLQQLGRVRANEITLVADDGHELYRSPAATYKQGRSAPAWFTALVLPPLERQVIRMPGATLSIEPSPSRAILDGWDELLQLAQAAGLALLVVNGLVFWALGRTLRPFGQIVQGLRQMQGGDYAHRLPPLPGREAGLIGEAVNQLGEAIEANVQQRIAAHQAERQLADSRDWSRLVEARLESERRDIAAELHDELGQSVTGIRALAKSLAQRLPAEDGVGREAAQLIDTEAARLYDAMHGMIPRLSPLHLGPLGLPDALHDLLATLRQRHPGLHFGLQVDDAGQPLDPALALALYRTAQEAVNNAIKHSGGQQIGLRLWHENGQMNLEITDDGCGLPAEAERPARFGLAGLRERLQALGGQFEAGRLPAGGSRLWAGVPCAGVAGTRRALQ